MSTALGSETSDGAFVPFKTEARPPSRNGSIDATIWLRENAAGDIEILEPMSGRRDREQMCAGLDKDMARDWQ